MESRRRSLDFRASLAGLRSWLRLLLGRRSTQPSAGKSPVLKPINHGWNLDRRFDGDLPEDPDASRNAVQLWAVGNPLFHPRIPLLRASEARYASVVFPFYIVLGYSLSRIPRVVSMLVLSAFAIYLGIFTAMFVSWYWFY